MKKTTANRNEKTLIIAEKPSVAIDITKALGGFTEKDGYYESYSYLVASAQGHLLTSKDEDELLRLNAKNADRIMEELPCLPDTLTMKPNNPQDKKKLAVLKKLINRKDVTELINACDAGREGELIFREIVEYLNAKQPISRLWLQSMTPDAIRNGFRNLKTDEEMLPLAEAARLRSLADWTVGINMTRAVTVTFPGNKEGKFEIQSLGRVLTPTLAMIVNREKQIRDFKPQDYWEINATFQCANGIYEGRWIDPSFKADKSNPEKRAGRIWDQKAVENIIADCRDKTATVSETQKTEWESAPRLFDLTSLQREANNRFGFSAKQTLDIAQKLYDTHKAITYPRTDSRYLPEDYVDVCRETIDALRSNPQYKASAGYLIEHKHKFLTFDAPIFNNREISDHFAIIPTPSNPKDLNNAEQQIYDLIVRQFLASLYPAAVYMRTTRYTDINGHRFQTSHRALTAPGWTEVFKKHRDIPLPLPVIEQNSSVSINTIQPEIKNTTPPARYTEATLLTAMERAGSPVTKQTEHLSMIGRGLGTPATRAGTIERLLKKYLRKEGRQLIPTAPAMQLIEMLEGMDMDSMTQAKTTENWEIYLNQIEKKELEPEEFLWEIQIMTRNYVTQLNNTEVNLPESPISSHCPNCGGTLMKDPLNITCSGCGFTCPCTINKRAFTDNEIETLMTHRRVGPLDNFIGKKGKPFSAVLELANDENGKLKLNRVFAPFSRASDTTNTPVVGKCPKCGGKVHNAKFEYICENAVNDTKKCTFFLEKTKSSRAIEHEEMEKLLLEGHTDLLVGFLSRKKSKPFSAWLVLDPEGNIKFEFPDRQ